MAITKEKLGYIGLSIKTNRKDNLRRTNAGKWTQKNFCDDVCSQNSLINLEKGHAGRFTDNYELLAAKLDMRLADDPIVDKKMKTYTKHLYEAVEYYDLDKIKKYVDKSLALLESYKDCLWYADLYKAVCVLREHYLHQNCILREERDHYADMIGEFSGLWDDLLKSMIYCSAFHDTETEEFEDRFKEFNIEYNNSAFNKVNTMLYYTAKDYMRKTQELYVSLKQEWTDNHNYIRLIDLYNSILVYSSYFDISEVDNIKADIKQIMEQVEIVEYKEVESYYCLGIAYYKLKKYDDAIVMMQKSYTHDRKKINAAVYVGHMQRLTGKEISIPYYDQACLAKYPKDICKIYEYFINIGNISTVESEKFLMTKVLPVLNIEDDFNVNVVKEEIEMLVDETKHYRNLMLFNKKVRKL